MVLWPVTKSLDGFIAAPDNSVDLSSGHAKPGPIARDVIDATGAIVMGRRMSVTGGVEKAVARAKGAAAPKSDLHFRAPH